ncbi:NAD(P)H-dependent oxidoreductase [Lacihabitans soyangensis]|uniref:Flavodoxin family protein n=1 Tax=Lacihabitans soyangensis TaxID=869394 RepID=A0AAE3H7B4_9BACT|nr:NAD(P)H-dependent oxidoreductase [Lacihabitans soyangensis]MCP9765401.1 flavodoxin family protein [Lacihabitans soyangensis]
MKKTLIIQGHPDSESYCRALANAYKVGAINAGAEVQEIIVSDLKFNPNLEFGYRKRTELESDLLAAQEKIKWAEHLVIIYPLWWGGMPALLKGFFDRAFLPGFAFQKRENSVWWDKYLTGKSARIITTMDQPAWYHWLIYGEPAHKALKKMILEFCGIKPVKITSIGPIRFSKDELRKKYLEKVKALGIKQI